MGRRNTWDATKCLILPLPMLFLAAFLLRLPFPVPAFLLPDRLYLALDRGSVDGETLKALRGRGAKAFAALEGRLLELPAPDAPISAFAEAAALFPDRPALEAVRADLAGGFPALAKARLIVSSPVAAESLASALDAAKAAGVPLAVQRRQGQGLFPLAAFSWRLEAAEERPFLELLFAPSVRGSSAISVRAGALELWRGEGSGLPPDLALRLEAPRAELAKGLRLEARDGGGKPLALDLDIGANLEERPRVLVISERKAGKSFIESLYKAERTDLPGGAARDLKSYELVVIDGIPISRIRGSLLAGLLDLNARRAGSILFAADSPDFGKKGDNPALEALLPVTLLPRNLKELPDLAILILIDASGSMFGDKLSLAKVTGLELLKELKPTDRVGLMVFSDRRQWVYEFQVNADIVAAPYLEPVAATGGTDLAAALSEGLDRLASQPIRERHAVVVSDGVTRPADFRALAARARAEGVTVSTMGIGEDLDRPLLERLALETKGRFYRVSGADAIPGLLFEDRKNEARPPFLQVPTPILALNGAEVATVTGMAIHSVSDPATVLYADKLGDPLLSSREYSNRAVLLFASDLYGTYTSDFLSRPDVAGAFKDRLDALFAERPVGIEVTEDAAAISMTLRSDSLAAPSLLLSSPGSPDLAAAFTRAGPSSWTCRIQPPMAGRHSAHIEDRGATVASFELASNAGLSGAETADFGLAATATAAQTSDPRARPFRTLDSPLPWLLLFFAASLCSTILLRVKR